LKGPLAMSPGLDCNPLVEQGRDFFPQLLLRFGVGDGHPGAPRLQKQGRSYARATESDHEDAFVVEIDQMCPTPQRHKVTEGSRYSGRSGESKPPEWFSAPGLPTQKQNGAGFCAAW